ncbi:hypothetical protein PMZ80_005480 [Knufia obscura]|uniref:Uncharacterized protein n=2 Tax=Knufia TaxID=430999 RepID=A0AAN8F727_9EURO|nr:hypothetical protein PMZ80_005480 [Knufia obscura]KAK5958153.1 hypothetical protein OHC33_001343 [Knufia fluminis]
MASSQPSQLSQADIDHFLQHGYVKLSSCFSQEASDSVISSVWTRLGVSPTDKSTWSSIPNLNAGRVNMPSHNHFPAKQFAPKAWSAICELVGGEEKISEEHQEWGDGLIVNLGTDENEGRDVRPQDLTGWHVDGDFFVHYLDSPEQALLVIPLFTNIRPGGGGTYICPPAISHIAKHLYENPEGVSPRFTTRSENPKFESENHLRWFNSLAASMPNDAFVEVTGQVGDVYLLHPLMLHSASNNKLREVRIITNPPVSLKEPFELQRADGSYSIVEQKTLKGLGREGGLQDWKIAAPRERVVPERLKRQAEMREKELERLKAIADARAVEEPRAQAIVAQ